MCVFTGSNGNLHDVEIYKGDGCKGDNEEFEDIGCSGCSVLYRLV